MKTIFFDNNKPAAAKKCYNIVTSMKHCDLKY